MSLSKFYSRIRSAGSQLSGSRAKRVIKFTEEGGGFAGGGVEGDGIGFAVAEADAADEISMVLFYLEFDNDPR